MLICKKYLTSWFSSRVDKKSKLLTFPSNCCLAASQFTRALDKLLAASTLSFFSGLRVVQFTRVEHCELLFLPCRELE